MKKLLKISVLAAAVAASTSFMSAETMQLGSYATGGSAMGNSNTAMNYAGFNSSSSAPSVGTGTSYFLDPSNVWMAAVPNSTWVGIAPNAGPVGTSNPDFGYYTFTTSFTAVNASSSQYSGSITVLADDTTEVLLNGVVVIPFGALGTDAHCADNAPTCLSLDTISGTTSLLAGVNANTLTFVVQQAGTGPKGGVGDPSGVDFKANLAAVSPVPEPSSLLMLGTGLFGSAGMLYRRARS